MRVSISTLRVPISIILHFFFSFFFLSFLSLFNFNLFSIKKNLAEKAPEENLQPLSDHKVHALCLNLLNRKWTDNDIIDDLTALSEILEKNSTSLGFLFIFYFFHLPLFFFFFKQKIS